jgi:hypothetical protein
MLEHRFTSISRLALGAACAVAPLLLAPWGAAAVAARENAEARAGDANDEIVTLKRQLELAGGDQFYLVLTSTPPTLRLMFQGISLREYPVHQLRLGRPRALFRPLRVADEWESRIWTGGRLDPPRRRAQITITPPRRGEDSASGSAAPDKEAEESASNPPESVPIPPNVEEAVPVPRVFRITFGDLILVVETGENGRAARPPATVKELFRGFRRFWEDRFAWLAPRIVRLRFRLEPPDAAHLYRSLPEDVSLGIVREETPFHAR